MKTKIEVQFQADLEKSQREAEEMFLAIMSANEPTVLASGSFEFLKKIAENRIEVTSDQEMPYLTQQELVMLSIRKGTLDEREAVHPRVGQTVTLQPEGADTAVLARAPSGLDVPLTSVPQSTSLVSSGCSTAGSMWG